MVPSATVWKVPNTMGCPMVYGVVGGGGGGGGGADGLGGSPDPDCSCPCFRLERSSELVELPDDDVGPGAAVRVRPPVDERAARGA